MPNTRPCQDWTIKENAQSISICWCGKVITQILLRRTPRDEAIANAQYIVDSCNYCQIKDLTDA